MKFIKSPSLIFKVIGIKLLLILTFFISSVYAQDSLNVKWSPDYTSLDFVYLGQHYQYPKDLAKEKFPSVGDKPQIEFKDRWPVVTMRARWTIAAKDWPQKYRSDAIDLILMYACSAELYEYIYPDSIRSSTYTFPPEFMQEAADSTYRLAEILRGKEVGYEVVAKGGFGASDYKIKTKIRIGLSEDAKNVFYFDKPNYISDYLESREFLFAGRDEGGEMHFEIIMLAICTPQFFKSEAIRRVKENGQYFVDRLYAKLNRAPTEAGIDRYLALVKMGGQQVQELLKKGQ